MEITKEHQWFKAPEVAKILGISEATLYGWYHKKKGPPAHTFCGNIRYSKADLDAFIESSREPMGG